MVQHRLWLDRCDIDKFQSGLRSLHKTESVLFKVTNNLLNHLVHHRAHKRTASENGRSKMERHYTGCLRRHNLESEHMERTCYRDEAHSSFMRKLVNHQLIRKWPKRSLSARGVVFWWFTIIMFEIRVDHLDPIRRIKCWRGPTLLSSPTVFCCSLPH